MQLEHHKRNELCTTRSRYREGRKLTAVKVYTVSQESRFIMVHGVPALGAHHDLIKRLTQYGTVEEYRILDEYPSENFTDTYLIKYQRIQSARIAKRKLDEYSFFGGVLHICYAPEYESVEDTRTKLQQRRYAVAKRLRELEKEAEAKKNTKIVSPSELTIDDVQQQSGTSLEFTVSSTSSVLVSASESISSSLVPFAPQPTVPLYLSNSMAIPITLPPPPHPLPRIPFPPPSLFGSSILPQSLVPPPPISSSNNMPDMQNQWHSSHLYQFRLSSFLGNITSLPDMSVPPPFFTNIPATHQNKSASRTLSSGKNNDLMVKHTKCQKEFDESKITVDELGTNHTLNNKNIKPKISNSEKDIIIKKIEIKPSASKLVPRQITSHKQINRQLLEAEENRVHSDRSAARQRIHDAVNDVLRKNALTLKAIQGPQAPASSSNNRLVPDNEQGNKAKNLLTLSADSESQISDKGFSKSDISPISTNTSITGDSSQDKTLLAIRKRVMEFSAKAMPPQLSKKRAKLK